ncbi:type II toxin-antitoxin system HicB family antitoxin [Pelotomaculum isophthalicicum JI]|uniref:Type II toxin-antitoxin system HicB family antitoxin n=1 Tax=Pelotomaculum isophthalicicum JI TaxID=947010 RepID=A0A9X4H0A4_9FIRM|nr:type II toxin-antitoxin system HicB family antitoxin [Pelotomaculum isophthalicicum]MDF9407065.1 type II toxin-antitoxin system HicB family antitoxin [Pelotomaculum isophthalicicum JI]
MMRNYLVIIEKANGNFSAYLPDVPGVIATGKNVEKTRKAIETALTMHLNGLKEDGLPIPEPAAHADYVVSAI